MSTIDFAADAESEIPEDHKLVQLSTLIDRMTYLEREISLNASVLEHMTKQLNELRDEQIPNLLAEMGFSSFTTASGRKISLKTEVHASIPGERSHEAFSWLREHGHGALIKNVISVDFGKGEDARAIEAATLLAEAGLRPEQKQAVHPMTLKAFLKEQLAAGVDVPLELFGAYIHKRAKVE